MVLKQACLASVKVLGSQPKGKGGGRKSRWWEPFAEYPTSIHC